MKPRCAWWTKWPDANVAISTKPSGLTIVDCDHGNQDAAAFHAWRAGVGLPVTYTVRTGRRDGFGVQMYYSTPGEAPATSMAWDEGTHSGDIRGSWGYVMAAGCLHPSGETYSVLVDAPIAPVPERARQFKKAIPKGRDGKPNPAWMDDGSPIEDHRNCHMISLLGRKRAEGYTDDRLQEYAAEVNQERMRPPLDEAELDYLIRQACKWPVGEPDPVVIIGGPKEVDTSLDAPELAKGPRPIYPLEVWEGTVYGEFGAACSARNFIPPKFFIESLRTVVGAVVGDRLRCNMVGVHPRSFTICIAPAGAGKGTSNEYVNAFFGELWDGLTRTGEAPLIWTDPAEHVWKSRGIGAQVASFSSAPGLMVAIAPPKLKKGESPNPLAKWRPIPRIITMAKEVRGLLANFANESTGAGLESVLCELFDRDSFTTTATKDRPPACGKLLYSLLGGITPEDWTSIFSKVESTGSGFQSRLNIVGTEEARRVGGLIKPDFEPMRRKLLPMIADLERRPLTIDPSDAALKRVEDWFHRLEMPEGISKSRLNIHAWRAGLHLAWLKGHTQIEVEDVEGGFKCAEYLVKMREWYAPPEGETRAARAEAAIRKVMRSRHRATVRELKAATSSKRISVGDWDKALKALCSAGEMRVAEEQGKRGQTRKVVILLREMD